jgi:SAM-dependent methyltransferase
MSRFIASPRLLVLLLVSPLLVVACAQEQASTTSIDLTSEARIAPPNNTLDTTFAPTGDVPFVKTPETIVTKMLELANVSEEDVVYDLGSGDGRIVIKAAKKFGAQGVGIEIKPRLVKKARENAKKAGVSDLVEFREGDLFDANISEATVVSLYLLPSVNTELRPKLFHELVPGTRVVSHDFDMGEWRPDTTWKSAGETIHRWTIPEELPPFVDAKK